MSLILFSQQYFVLELPVVKSFGTSFFASLPPFVLLYFASSPQVFQPVLLASLTQFVRLYFVTGRPVYSMFLATILTVTLVLGPCNLHSRSSALSCYQLFLLYSLFLPLTIFYKRLFFLSTEFLSACFSVFP